MKCSELMTRNPLCCVTTTTVDKVAQLMLVEDIGAIPVVDSLESKTLLGIVTDRDLALGVVASGLHPRITPVSYVMSSFPTIACEEEENVGAAISLMEEVGVRRIPIIDHDHHLRGIISASDVISKFDNPSKTLELVESLSCCRVPKSLAEASQAQCSDKIEQPDM